LIVFVHKAHETLQAWSGPNVGRLLSPRQFSRATDTAATGMPWAADNDCFQGLDAIAYVRMLDAITDLPGCLFVVAPDAVGDWEETRERFEEWTETLDACGQPVAYVIQDGQPISAVPWGSIAALFVGGSTEFKCSDQAHDLVREAHRRCLWTHMGRVNTARRMTLAKSWGIDSIDGTSVSMYTDKRLPERIEQARAPRQLNLRGSIS
jgi:hypothetical protein